jgi:hypothetical protein
MSSKRFLSTINLSPLSSDPASGTEGDAYFNISTNKIRVYYDGAWNDLGGESADEISYSSSPPLEPLLGDIWIDSESNIDIQSIFFSSGGEYNSVAFESTQSGGDPSTNIYSFTLDGGTP